MHNIQAHVYINVDAIAKVLHETPAHICYTEIENTHSF